MARATRPISANDARGGDIVLKRRWERVVFIVGLAACVVLGAAVALSRLWS
jgi:hypothetical protein